MLEDTLICDWRSRWPGPFDCDGFSNACVDLVDKITQQHRRTGELPISLVQAVIRDVMVVLIGLPSGSSPKPRPPQQDIWGLAAAEFLFEVIEWCRLTDLPNRSLVTAPPLERNLAVRDYLMANPLASLRHVASALRIPAATVNRTPAWRALAERRRDLSDRKPRASSFHQSEHAIPSRESELDDLIEEQSRDSRCRRVFASERV